MWLSSHMNAVVSRALDLMMQMPQEFMPLILKQVIMDSTDAAASFHSISYQIRLWARHSNFAPFTVAPSNIWKNPSSALFPFTDSLAELCTLWRQRCTAHPVSTMGIEMKYKYPETITWIASYSENSMVVCDFMKWFHAENNWLTAYA